MLVCYYQTEENTVSTGVWNNSQVGDIHIDANSIYSLWETLSCSLRFSQMRVVYTVAISISLRLSWSLKHQLCVFILVTLTATIYTKCYDNYKIG